MLMIESISRYKIKRELNPMSNDLFLILFALFLVIFFVFILIFICTRLSLLCSFLCSARLCIFHWFGCCSLFLLLFLSQFSETRIQVRFPSLLCLLFIASIRLLSLINCFLSLLGALILFPQQILQ